MFQTITSFNCRRTEVAI